MRERVRQGERKRDREEKARGSGQRETCECEFEESAFSPACLARSWKSGADRRNEEVDDGQVNEWVEGKIDGWMMRGESWLMVLILRSRSKVVWDGGTGKGERAREEETERGALSPDLSQVFLHAGICRMPDIL